MDRQIARLAGRFSTLANDGDRVCVGMHGERFKLNDRAVQWLAKWHRDVGEEFSKYELVGCDAMREAPEWAVEASRQHVSNYQWFVVLTYRKTRWA